MLYHHRTGPVCPGCRRPGGRGRTPPLGTCRGPPCLSPGESPPSLTIASYASGTSPAESSWPTPRQIPVMVKFMYHKQSEIFISNFCNQYEVLTLLIIMT